MDREQRATVCGWSSSPNHFQSIVLPELTIRADEWNILCQRSRDEHSIEGIAVMGWQTLQAQRMIRAKGDHLRTQKRF